MIGDYADVLSVAVDCFIWQPVGIAGKPQRLMLLQPGSFRCTELHRRRFRSSTQPTTVDCPLLFIGDCGEAFAQDGGEHRLIFTRDEMQKTASQMARGLKRDDTANALLVQKMIKHCVCIVENIRSSLQNGFERFRRGINRNDFELRKKSLQLVRERIAAWHRHPHTLQIAEIADIEVVAHEKIVQHLEVGLCIDQKPVPFGGIVNRSEQVVLTFPNAFEQLAPGVGFKDESQARFLCDQVDNIPGHADILTLVIDHVERRPVRHCSHADERVLPDPSALVRCQSDTGFHLPCDFVEVKPDLLQHSIRRMSCGIDLEIGPDGLGCRLCKP